MAMLSRKVEWGGRPKGTSPNVERKKSFGDFARREEVFVLPRITLVLSPPELSLFRTSWLPMQDLATLRFWCSRRQLKEVFYAAAIICV